MAKDVAFTVRCTEDQWRAWERAFKRARKRAKARGEELETFSDWVRRALSDVVRGEI